MHSFQDMMQTAFSNVQADLVVIMDSDKSEVEMSPLMRLWYFSSSVHSFFKHTGAAIQWG